MNKSVKVLGFVVVLAMAMFASGLAAMASADVASESNGTHLSATIYVPDNHTKIQWAIDNATDGDMIIVDASGGPYFENVVVDKQLSLIGIELPVVNAGGRGSAINVTEDGCLIEGFYATGATESWIGKEAGIKVRSNNNVIKNNIANSNSAEGIDLGCTSNNTIINNTASNNGVSYGHHGIHVGSSSNNTLMNNVANANNIGGISLAFSSENTLIDNTALDNDCWGIELLYSSSNILRDNVALNNNYGIFLQSSSNNNMVKNNNVSNGGTYGVRMEFSSSNTLSNNFFKSNHNYGISLSESSGNILTNNMVLSNHLDGIQLSSSNSNTLINNIVSDNTFSGIILDDSNNNNITKNSVSKVLGGISLFRSSNNIITNNTISKNDYGIRLSYSSNNNNLIFHNNLINNSNNAEDGNPANNDWHHPVILEGNYWSDYTGADDGSGTGKHARAGDGIGDTDIPHPSADFDFYPFMNENGWIITSTTFDTREGTYPSIMGTHKGTIKPSHDVIVNKMYTYPCAGTGGHSEWVAFYNSTTGEEIANGTWKGYAVGDYHYIEFDTEFILHEGVPYNYTIKTGSYPQIIHAHVFTTMTDGEISCAKFVDANGNEYNDWIPAIRLE